jgi:hypothetical protein
VPTLEIACASFHLSGGCLPTLDRGTSQVIPARPRTATWHVKLNLVANVHLMLTPVLFKRVNSIHLHSHSQVLTHLAACLLGVIQLVRLGPALECCMGWHVTDVESMITMQVATANIYHEADYATSCNTVVSGKL